MEPDRCAGAVLVAPSCASMPNFPVSYGWLLLPGRQPAMAVSDATGRAAGVAGKGEHAWKASPLLMHQIMPTPHTGRRSGA